MDEKIFMSSIATSTLPKDSGEKRKFSTGAQRDDNVTVLKGRMDLLPHNEVALCYRRAKIMQPIEEGLEVAQFYDCIDAFMKDKNVEHLADAICIVHASLDEYKNLPMEYMFLDVSVLYQTGAIKYKENNWKNGMPVKVYIDCGCRHYHKARVANYAKRNGMDCEYFDEPHYRGPVWNLLCAMWTATNLPEMLADLVVIEKA